MTSRHFRLLVFYLLICSGVPHAFGADQNLLVFTHATVIDATGAPAQSDVTVVVTGDRISAMGKSVEVRPPPNAVVVDATGKFLIPGLWDMHVHWYQKVYLPLFIANGVTGVRMMWGQPMHHEWRKEIEQGSLLGPRMFIASPIVDGAKPLWPGSIAARNEADGRQAVRDAKRDGADFVKVYSLLSRETYFAIADECKKQGIPFAGHVPLSVSVEEASEAGQRSFEHLYGILPAGSSRAADFLKSAQEALAANLVSANEPISVLTGLRRSGQLQLETYSAMKAETVFAIFKRNHTWQCPTLTVLRSINSLDDPSITNDTRLKYMPAQVKSSWDPTSDFRFKDRTPEDVALARRIYQKNLEIVGAMQRAGVGILAGTDVLNPYCFPGFSLHNELGLLVRAGLTPMEALQTATLNPARFMAREKDLGTIENGKLADLVLLDANPLDDIANTRKVNSVVVAGRLFCRGSLDELLARAEALANKKSIAEALLKTIKEADIDAAIKQYRELKLGQSDSYDFGEGELNNLGYELLGMKRFKDAVSILRLNVEAHPESTNVYDSLGEAYMDDGQNELAIENYEKSLKLDPKNSSAIQKLKQLKAR